MYTAKMKRLGKRVRDESLQVEPLKEHIPPWRFLHLGNRGSARHPRKIQIPMLKTAVPAEMLGDASDEAMSKDVQLRPASCGCEATQSHFREKSRYIPTTIREVM